MDNYFSQLWYVIFTHKVYIIIIIAVGTLEIIIGPFFFYGLILLPLIFWFNLERGVHRTLPHSQEAQVIDSLLRASFFIYIFVFNALGLTNSWVPLTCWPVFVIMLRFRVWGATIVRWVRVDLIRFLSHMTPSDLPLLGAPLIAVIEILSRLIRPLTLGIRLCANITGGHLITELIEEIGGGLISSTLVGFYELFVCFIQRLIFRLLLLSYFRESSESI